MNKYTVFLLGREFGYAFYDVACVDMGDAYQQAMRWIALPPGFDKNCETLPGATLLPNGWLMCMVCTDYLSGDHAL